MGRYVITIDCHNHHSYHHITLTFVPGACSKLGGVALMFGCSGGGPAYYKQMGIQNLNWMTYFRDDDGCPTDFCSYDSTDGGNPPTRGGWQEDCHFDVLHNFVDGLVALESCTSGV